MLRLVVRPMGCATNGRSWDPTGQLERPSIGSARDATVRVGVAARFDGGGELVFVWAKGLVFGFLRVRGLGVGGAAAGQGVGGRVTRGGAGGEAEAVHGEEKEGAEGGEGAGGDGKTLFN